MPTRRYRAFYFSRAISAQDLVTDAVMLFDARRGSHSLQTAAGLNLSTQHGGSEALFILRKPLSRRLFISAVPFVLPRDAAARLRGRIMIFIYECA